MTWNHVHIHFYYSMRACMNLSCPWMKEECNGKYVGCPSVACRIGQKKKPPNTYENINLKNIYGSMDSIAPSRATKSWSFKNEISLVFQSQRKWELHFFHPPSSSILGFSFNLELIHWRIHWFGLGICLDETKYFLSLCGTNYLRIYWKHSCHFFHLVMKWL